MERRLLLAKELLNPDDSVLIVTIDEKEYLRLGLLLEQIFPEADIQMVSDVINRAGSPRANRFSRVDEYVFFVFIGDAGVTPWTSTMLGDDEVDAPMPTVWFTAVRSGSGSEREDKKSGKASFYPVIIHKETGAFIRVGDPLPHGVSRHDVPLGQGELAIWPLANDGRETRWRFSSDVMRRYFANGTARLGTAVRTSARCHRSARATTASSRIVRWRGSARRGAVGPARRRYIFTTRFGVTGSRLAETNMLDESRSASARSESLWTGSGFGERT